MINPSDFLKCIKQNRINFYTGVPDSLFSGLCSFMETEKNHISATNEGSAIGLAIGHYLAKKQLPLVYLQNSGLGNIINPITSLVNKDIYQIPIVMLIGWRGEIEKGKQISDEPQHKFQGKITIDLLKLLKIKFIIINNKSDYKKRIKDIVSYSRRNLSPVAIVIRKNTFKKYKKIKRENFIYPKRREILNKIVEALPNNFPIVSTTGVLSRELIEINILRKEKINPFICVGGMGHASSIANGLAFSKKNKKIICLDGDGAALMHLGSQINLSTMKNIIHILINNNCHDSVGGQSTPSKNIKFYKLAKELGYKNTYYIEKIADIKKVLKKCLIHPQAFIEIKSSKGYSKNLSRPNKKILFYKKEFIKRLK